MNLLIQDKNDTVLPLFNEENFFKINGIPHNIRSNKLERYQQSGSVLQGDLKSPPYNYETLAANSSEYYTIDEVKSSKATDSLRRSLGTQLYIGFVDMEISKPRYPRQN